jgi:hypothetical protein
MTIRECVRSGPGGWSNLSLVSPADRWASFIRKKLELNTKSPTATDHDQGDAIGMGRKPGMPLSILSNIAREAPLGSLSVAFLLGVAVARR